MTNDTEITRLRLLLAERDKMIDELLALLSAMTADVLARLKEQHERLVFNIEHRRSVD